MKKNLFLPLFSATILFCACNNESSTDSTTTKDTTVTEPVVTEAPAVTDTTSKMTAAANTDPAVSKFVEDAAIAGMMEIELGKLAMSKTKNERVGTFAAMMVNDHNAAAAELKTIASANGVAVPTEIPADKKKHMDMMKDMSGTSFDKHYMDMMVKDHGTVVDEFKAASKDLKNDALKGFAAKTTPVLEKHLDSAKAINKKL